MLRIADPRALIRLSLYFARPYIDFLNRLRDQERIFFAEKLAIVNEVGVKFDELATGLPEIRDHEDVLGAATRGGEE